MDLSHTGGIPRPPTPALDTWRQFRSRKPITEFDALWRAACWEVSALEAWRQNQPALCLAALARAEAIAHEELEHLEGLDLP